MMFGPIIRALAYTGPMIIGLSTPTLATQDKCERDDQKLRANIPGSFYYLKGDLRYESRSEDYSRTAYRYIYCIHNDRTANTYSVRVTWGTDQKPERFFNAEVAAGDLAKNIYSDSSDETSSDENFVYRAQYDQQHHHDVETIYDAARAPFFDRGIYFIQFNPNQSPDPFSAYVKPDGLIDLAALFADGDDTARFLRAEGSIHHFALAEFYVPTSDAIADAVADQKYDIDNPVLSDFTSLDIYVRSEIKLDETGGKFNLANVISLSTSDSEDQANLPKIARTLEEQFIALQPSESMIGSDFWPDDSVSLEPAHISEPVYTSGNAFSDTRFEEREGTLRIVDKDGREYGSMTFTFFARAN